MGVYSKEDLVGFQPLHDSFVGIDSDGCVFDTMCTKQCDHFHPLIIDVWHLEAIETELRAAAEFVNLYSKWRGGNRFSSLLKTFELLEDWDAVRESEVTLPDLTSLRTYVQSGAVLGEPSLALEVDRTGDAELQRVLAWSRATNIDIDQNMKAIEPFEWCGRSLELMSASSDMIVVSQTPEEALVKEWQLHEIDRYVSLIAGQELGTKAEHLQMATGGKYDESRVLLIGDALGDLAAARAVSGYFYPILPGDEETSWQRFHDEAYAKFLAGEYAGDYEQRLVAEFKACLPETPPWERGREEEECGGGAA
jgi:phosphoglycolate phosphatase-like HAD superfamily hydrolase